LNRTQQAPQTTPQRFSVQIYHEGGRIRRGTNIKGQTLRSIKDASELISDIKKDMEAAQFSFKKWKQRKGIDFAFSHLVWKWVKEKENDQTWAPSYKRKIGSYVKYYMLPYFKDMDVEKIVSGKQFYKSLPDRLSLKYKKNILDATKNFFKWLKGYSIYKALIRYSIH